jgi:hypothetical protein
VETYRADSLEDLSNTLEYVRLRTAEIARQALEAVQRAGGMQDAVVVVDGRVGQPEDTVKLFGKITYATAQGPLQEAIDLAFDYVSAAVSQFKQPTGFYAANFRWFVNGTPTGGALPDASRVGRRGNVQFVDVAGYAAMPEIFVPGGVLYGAARAIERRYGQRIAVKFGYAPVAAFDLAWPAGRKASYLAVPTLTLGYLTASFAQGRKSSQWAKPGKRARKREQQRRRATGQP